MLPERNDTNNAYTGDDDNPGCETTMVVTLLSLISGGFTEGQKALVETAAYQCDMSAEYARAILRRYTGPTFGKYLWKCRRGIRGQRLYEVLAAN